MRANLMMRHSETEERTFSEFHFNIEDLTAFYITLDDGDVIIILNVDGTEYPVEWDEELYETCRAALGYD